MEKFREYAVLEVRELPARQHAARVHGISPLRFEAAPIGGNGGHDYLVAHLQILDKLARFDDFADGLVAQNHIVPFTDRSFPDGVDVGRTRGHCQRLDNRVQRSACGDVLLYPACLAYAKHSVTFHFHNRFSSSDQIPCL